MLANTSLALAAELIERLAERIIGEGGGGGMMIFMRLRKRLLMAQPNMELVGIFLQVSPRCCSKLRTYSGCYRFVLG